MAYTREQAAKLRMAQRQEEQDFRRQLEAEYMSDIEEQKARDAVWALAWEYGHSNGYEEVRSYYIDLVQLAYQCMYR